MEEITQLEPPVIPVIQSSENNTRVVLQLEGLGDAHEIPNLVIQIPNAGAEPKSRYTFKERSALVYGGWGTTLFFLSKLRSNSKNVDYKDMMERGAAILMLSFISWVANLLCYQSSRNVGRSFTSRVLVYGGAYGGTVVALGVTFFTLYIPVESHTPFFTSLLVCTIGFLILIEICMTIKKKRNSGQFSRMVINGCMENVGYFWEKVKSMKPRRFWQKIKNVRRGDSEEMELMSQTRKNLDDIV